MTVSGRGVGDPERSLDVLEQQVAKFLPKLRNAYERERSQDAALMGNLEVTIAIEPNGTVSDVRFPVKRVSNERLTSVTFDQMRTWRFSAADLPVQLQFTLLFVPPGIDEASIFRWEKQLGNRPLVEKVGEPPIPVVVATLQASEANSPKNSPRRQEEGTLPLSSELSSTATPNSGPATAFWPEKRETHPEELTGWYRVLHPTVLRANPQESAQVVARLRVGLRIQVVSVVQGQWLEVHSVSKRPPGFLWWEDAVWEGPESGERKEG
jgi:hypothetical protein